MNRRSFIKAGLALSSLAAQADVVFRGRSAVRGRVTVSPAILSGIAAIPNFKLWIDPAVGVTLDGSSRVQTLVEKQNSVTFSQASSGPRPAITASAINGLPAISSDGTPRYMTSPNQASVSDYTLFAVMKVTSGTASWFGKGALGTTREFSMFNGTTFIASGSYNNAGPFQHDFQGAIISFASLASFQIICLRKEGMHMKLWLNGTLKSMVSGGNPTYINNLGSFYTLLGTDVTGSTNTQIAEQLFFGRALNSTELTDINTYLATKFAISSPFTPSLTLLPGIVFLGDSLTTGVLGTAPARRTVDDATVGLNHLSRVWDYAIDGFPGRNASDMLANFDIEVTPYLRNGDVLSLWAGTNDLVNGALAGDVIISLDGIVAKVRASGKTVKVLVSTIMNRSAFTAAMGSTAGTESGYQASINSHIRSGMDRDGVCDVQGLTNLQNTANTTYFADGTHLTTAGDNDYSDALITSINAL